MTGDLLHMHWRDLAEHVRQTVGQVDALIVDAFDRLNQDTVDRFWSRIRQDGECWIWTAGRDPFGYGKFALTTGHRHGSGKPKQVHLRAHRFAWALANAVWLGPETYLLHSCDRPACCNPAHLRPGTQRDNIRDMDSKGRRGRCPVERLARGDRHGQTKISDADVKLMRSLRSEGWPHKALSERFGIHISTVGNILRGKARAA